MYKFILIFLLGSIGVFAGVEGKVIESKGITFIKGQEGGFKKLAINTEISNGDILKTSKDSSLVIELNDSSKLTVYQNSVIKIDESKIGQSSKSLTLFSGKLWANVSKKLTKDNYFKVNTPTSTAGVRGTDFGVVVAENGSSLVKVNSGSVAFDSDLDPKAQENIKTEEISNEEEDPLKSFMGDGNLTFRTSKINKEDSSINVDDLTGIKKKSIVLGENQGASFRLSKGLDIDETKSTSFENDEKMPSKKEEREKIVTWHISNLEKRLQQTDQILFKVTKISGDIDSVLNDKKIDVVKISATTQKGKRELTHMASELNTLQNSMDAQLYFLESIGESGETTKKILSKCNENKEKTTKMLEKVEKY